MTRRVAAGCLSAALGLAPAAAADPTTVRAPDWGVAVTYPSDLVAGDTFKPNYFDRGAWRFTYAADAGPGTRILALSLPDLKASDDGGESIATAELRIGASRDPDSVANCLSYGMHSGNDVETRSATIGGVAFTEVPDNTDTEMMKTIRTDDFRAVRKGVCFAIDLVVFVGGTSNRRPEFSAARLDRLRSVLSGIHFE